MSLPDQDVLLLHNARCSKSRATHALLTEHGHTFVERFYLEDPLTREELAELHKRLGRPLHAWIRRGESAYAEAGLEANSSEDALLDAMAKFPILVERPIVIRGSRARVGRPPEAVLELFGES